MSKVASCVAAVVLLAITLSASSPSSDEQKVWTLENAYWQYVQADDLNRYRALWHANFLGWPSVSPEPLRKDHITDWITAHTSKGENLKSFTLDELSIQVTGDVATTAYRIRQSWVEQNGTAHTSVIRIIHTWLRSATGSWQIISGMSAPTNSDGH